jgi:2-phospho-L-lactate guanylyltransferase
LKTFAIIPVKKFENAKTRLSSILTADERVTLSGLMLQDTLATLVNPKRLDKILVVSSDSRAKKISEEHDAVFICEEKDSGVNSAIMLADRYSVDAKADATIVIPQDLPLLDAGEIDRICEAAGQDSRCIVICPSTRYDGTNILLRKPPTVIKIHYDNNSYNMHVKSAAELGLQVRVFESQKLMFDIDKPDDVRELAAMPDEMITAKLTSSFLKSKVLDKAA